MTIIRKSFAYHSIIIVKSPFYMLENQLYHLLQDYWHDYGIIIIIAK